MPDFTITDSSILSTDTKPTAPAGTLLRESDTGDVHISDGTYWWLCGAPSPLSNRKIGYMQWSQNVGLGTGMLHSCASATGIGATTFPGDSTNGRYTNYPTLTTLGNKAGFRVNIGTLFLRAFNPRIRFRFMVPTSGDYTLARLYLGIATNAEPTGDTALNSAAGCMVGFVSGGTHFKIFHNDAGAAGDYDDDVAASPQALDTNIHEVRIVADEANTRFSVKWDTNPYVHITTDIPSSTNLLSIIMQNETNESGVAKAFRLYSCAAQSDK